MFLAGNFSTGVIHIIALSIAGNICSILGFAFAVYTYCKKIQQKKNLLRKIKP